MDKYASKRNNKKGSEATTQFPIGKHVLPQTEGELEAEKRATAMLKKFQIFIKGAMKKLTGHDGSDRGQLLDLQHGNGDNFNIVYFAPRLIDGITQILVVTSRDNKGGNKIKKLPGGGSFFGEKVEKTLLRESLEEIGIRPTKVTLVWNSAKALFSRESKATSDTEYGYHHHKFAFFFDRFTGIPTFTNFKDHDLTKVEFMPIKEVLADPMFHQNTTDGGHLALVKLCINHIKWDDELSKRFPDVCKL